MTKISKDKIPTKKSKKSTKNKLSYTAKIQKEEEKNTQLEQMQRWRTICSKYRRNKPILSTFLLEFVLLIFHNINTKYPIYNVLTPLNELPLSVNYRTNPSHNDHFNFNRLPATSKFKFLLSIDDDSVIEKYLTLLRDDDVFSEFDAVSQQYPEYKAQMEAGEWEKLAHLNGEEIRRLVDVLGSIENPEERNLSATTNSSQEEPVCNRLFPWMFQGGRKKRKTKKRKKRKTLKHKRKRKTKNKRKKKKNNFYNFL